ncbi:MAG: hypothetical protein QOI63_1304, partial [Thermoplasmata archaeon]|nr:hypothetical protein [Thermoplasmata archaeon]
LAFRHNVGQVVVTVASSSAVASAVGTAMGSGGGWITAALASVGALAAAFVAAFVPMEAVRRCVAAATQWSLRAADWDVVRARLEDGESVKAADYARMRRLESDAYVALEGVPYNAGMAQEIQAEIIKREGLGRPEE